jgi:hypothetical protein
MPRPILLVALIGSGLLAAAAGGQNQPLSDILKGGVKRGSAAPAPPKPPPAPASTAAPPAGAARPEANRAFRMELPPGWRAELTAAQAVVARSADASAVVLIAPVTDSGPLSAAQYLQRRGAPGIRTWFPNASVTGIWPSRLGPAAALASLEFQSPAGPGRGAALLFLSGGLGTLYVIGCPAAAYARQQPTLIRILRSFAFEGQPAPAGGSGAQPPAAAPRMSFVRFTDPHEGAFSCEVPSGWRTQGGLVRKSTVDVRGFLRLSSPDGAIHVFSGDPQIGSFVVPNPTLAMSGFREGSAYSPGYGNVMIVRRYIPGIQFAREYAVSVAQSLGAGAFQIQDARERPDLSGQQQGMAQETWTAGEVAFLCQIRGESAGYVLAMTKLTAMYGTALWQVPILAGFVASREQAATAVAVMQRLFETFEINPDWFARQQATTAQTSAIVTETNEHVSRIITESYWKRQRAQDRMAENFSDYIRGRVRLRDPETGEELEGRAGNNYYWRIRGTRTIVGNDTGTPPPSIDVTELEQVR